MPGNMQIEARVNIITLTTILVATGISWGTIKAQMSNLAEKIADQETSAVASEIRHRDTQAGHEARIRTIEQSSARQDERLLLILDSVRKIEAKLDQSGGTR